MSTWIFQGNPINFNIDSYLEDYYNEGNNILWGIHQNETLFINNEAKKERKTRSFFQYTLIISATVIITRNEQK